MSDIVERLRHCADNCGDEYLRELSGRAADEITALRAEVERLRAEVETWVGKAKTAIWADSEECKLLSADNERLRAALKTARPFIGWAGHYPTILAEIDATLKEEGE